MDVNGIYFSDKLITYFKRVSSDTSNAIKVGLKDFILFNFFFSIWTQTSPFLFPPDLWEPPLYFLHCALGLMHSIHEVLSADFLRMNQVINTTYK